MKPHFRKLIYFCIYVFIFWFIFQCCEKIQQFKMEEKYNKNKIKQLNKTVSDINGNNENKVKVYLFM